MKRLRVYVDTSVIGGCFDPEFTTESQALLQMARDGKVILVISDLLLDELATAPERVRALIGSLSEPAIEHLPPNTESVRLQQAYMAAGVVGPSSTDDARHVANATVARVDVIVSWNFRHIVHFDKIRHYNAVNLREGYGILEIRSPKEVV